MPPPRLTKRHRLLVRWGGLSVLVAVVAAVAIAVANRHERQVVPAAGAAVEGLTSVLTRGLDPATVPIRFEDVTETVGLSFRLFPAERASLLPEDMGSGVACGDYDGDGYTDLFCVNFAGSVAPGAKIDRARGRSRLYRNDGGKRFVDVTEQAGIDFVGFGMGAAWGDFDSDGDLDLYVTAYGPNALYENVGQGRFRNVTDRLGVQDERFSAGCSWADYDRDGDLDLYVVNYVAFRHRASDQGTAQRQYGTEMPYTLNPSSYPAQANALFRNNGDGTFTECAAQAGVADPAGRGLSASWVDLDNDGWVDLYVANDVSNNGVFRNRGDGTFADIGASSLAADYRGAMGIAVADIDDDLDQDLVITHWVAQENALYENMVSASDAEPAQTTRLWFMDAADQYGLGQAALDMVGWATGFCDFDNDGRRDLWIVNGHTLEQRDDHRQLVPQRAFVFWQRGPKDFVDVAAHACARLGKPFVGRGGAQLDFDHDGRVDLVMLIHGQSAIVLRNTSPSGGHWLRIDLRQTGGNTGALGARAFITAAGVTRMAEVGTTASYLSQDEHTLHFGLGDATRVDRLRIVWPDGEEEVHEALPADNVLRYTHAARYPVAAPARETPTSTARTP